MRFVGVCVFLCAMILGFWNFSFSKNPTTLYQFTKIADTGSTLFLGFYLSPSIDKQGRVLFRASLVNGKQGIFQSDGSATTQIAITTESFEAFRGSPAVSDDGQIVFLGSRSNEDFGYSHSNDVAGKFLYSNKEFKQLGDLVINNTGMLAFKGKRAKGWREKTQVFIGDGGRPIAIPDSKNNQIGQLSLNNYGYVTFSTGDKVYMSDGKTTELLIDGDKEYFLFYRPVINDHGTVVVQAASESQEGWIVKHLIRITDNQVQVLATTKDSFRDLLSSHSVNKHGHVAFGAVLESGLIGIFLNLNPISDVVVKQGDQLFGEKIMEGPVFSNRGFNDAGQIVFYARLEDGTEGIYRADPTF